VSDFTNENYKAMYSLFEYKPDVHQYALDENVFDELKLDEDIREATGLERGTLGDWWVFEPNGNPILSWHDLIRLSLGILHCRATKLLVHNLHLNHLPNYDIHPDPKLKSKYVSGAKRVNAVSGDYTDYSAYTGLAGLMNPDKDISQAPVVSNSDDMFRLHGKDESCCVEGTWFDWVAFACNVLASENTKIVAPALYEPKLANSNY
jgi:hypothetical protein